MKILNFNNVYVKSFAAVGGKKEGEGPLGSKFDKISDDNTFDEETWEKTESKMQEKVVEFALSKEKMQMSDLDFIFAGDLLNQCTSSSFGIKSTNTSFVGMYGACSTMALTILNGSVYINSNMAQNVACVTSSHFCSAERQFRFPLEYGSQRTENAQWTVTGSGGVILNGEKSEIKVSRGLIGKINDYGISDLNNMGAAMAPAAMDSFVNFFTKTGTAPSDYDFIFTGDLGAVGKDILIDLMAQKGYDFSLNYNDCGLIIYNKEDKNIKSGASGCGCSASVLATYILPKIKNGDFNKVLFAPTGALMSPTSAMQGENILGISHIVEFVRGE